MKQVIEKPTTGQFIQTWVYEGNTFAVAMLWNEDNTLEVYIPNVDWTLADAFYSALENYDHISGIAYFVTE